MQLNARHIQIITLVILFTILGGQAIWIYNLYEAQHRLITQVKDQALQAAILQEHRYRHEIMGGTIVSNPRFHEGDTSRYTTKTITLIDTSFQVQFDRYDPYVDVKLSQFILKDHMPLNIDMLDSLYKKELSNRGVTEASTYIEYIDIKNDKVLQHSKPNDSSGEYSASELVVIDIFNTLGIKGYIQISPTAIIKTMILQLVLTALLIIICSFFLTIIIRTFFRREAAEHMRQNAINGMIHEFKRPISVAVSQMSLISHYLGRDNIDRVEKYAEQSLLELQKLNTYTQRIQKISNNDRGTIYLDKKYINLHDFFSSLVERYNRTEKNSPIRNITIQTTQTTVYADLLHFANIMDNLIENAIKYAKENGAQVDILVADEQKKLKISVEDNGLGISQKDLPHIFQKFYRNGNKETQRKPGFGLGLTYVKVMVEAHKGEIKVESKLGIGSKFIVYFPIKQQVELTTNHAKQDFIN